MENKILQTISGSIGIAYTLGLNEYLINIKEIIILNNFDTIKLYLFEGKIMEFLIGIGFFFALLTYSLYKENRKEDKKSC